MKACPGAGLRRLVKTRCGVCRSSTSDLYQVHWIDAKTPIEETLSALTDLVRKGYVRYLGCSNFSAWRLMQALWASDKHGFERFVSVQPEYSLTQPTRAEVRARAGSRVRGVRRRRAAVQPLSGRLFDGQVRT